MGVSDQGPEHLKDEFMRSRPHSKLRGEQLKCMAS